MDVSECCSLRRMGRPWRRSDEAICQCADAENSGPAGTCSMGWMLPPSSSVACNPTGRVSRRFRHVTFVSRGVQWP